MGLALPRWPHSLTSSRYRLPAGAGHCCRPWPSSAPCRSPRGCLSFLTAWQLGFKEACSKWQKWKLQISYAPTSAVTQSRMPSSVQNGSGPARTRGGRQCAPWWEEWPRTGCHLQSSTRPCCSRRVIALMMPLVKTCSCVCLWASLHLRARKLAPTQVLHLVHNVLSLFFFINCNTHTGRD